MSAQDKLDRRAAKHGLGSDERKRKIQKAKDFFSKPVPTYSKDELRKMGHPVETTDADKAQKEGMFDIKIPAPKGSNKNTDKQIAAKAARRAANRAKTNKAKVAKAMAKDVARSASGGLKRTDDHRRKNYQSGKSGAYFSKYENVEEKAVSKSQQKFMGMVRAVQKGDMKQAPSPEVAKAAKTMSKKDVKDFASTKHKGLPESSVEYGKSMDRIKDKEKNAAIKPKDRETLGKLADLMKKQKRNEAYRKPTQAEIDADKRKDGKSKDSSTRYHDMKKKMYGNAMGGLKRESSLEEKYAVKYTHPTDKKSGRTTGPMSKAAADKKAAMGNRVDRVGGKYTVIPHVEAAGQEYTAVPIKTGDVSQADRLTIAKMDAIMKKRSKDKRQKEDWRADSARRMRNQRIANEPYRGPSEPDTRTDAERMADRAKLAKRFAADKAKQDKAVASKKESVNLEENKIFFVKVGDGRDSMVVKTKASNSREAMKKMRDEYPKKKVSLDRNQKQGRPAGAFESVETNESVSSADRKPQNYRDPETGKMKVRMVPVDRDVVRGDDAARVVRKKRFKHMRKEQMATGNSRVGKDGRDAFMKAFKDIQKTAAEIQKKKDADKK